MSDQITKEHVDKMLSWLPEESVLKNPLGEVERLSTKVVPTLHRDIITLQSRLTAAETMVKGLEMLLSHAISFIDPHIAPQTIYTNGQMAEHLRAELEKLKGSEQERDLESKANERNE